MIYKYFNSKFSTALFTSMMMLFTVEFSIAQCDVNDFTVTPVHGTCFSNASILVEVPGATTCTNWMAIIELPSGTEQSISIPANGGPVNFNALVAGNYNVRLFNPIIGQTILYDANPVVLTTTYETMAITSSYVNTTCGTGDANLIADGELTININSGGVGPFIYSVTSSEGTETFGPSMDTTHTFNTMPNTGEQVSFTVTDQVNGQAGCEVNQTQLRTLTVRDATPWSITLAGRRTCENGNCDEVRVTIRLSRGELSQGVVNEGNIPTYTIDGGIPQQLLDYAILGGSNFYVEYSVVMNVGQTIEVTAEGACVGTVTNSYTPPAFNDDFVNFQRGVSTANCGEDYWVRTTWTSIYNWCPNITYLVEKNDGAGNWVEEFTVVHPGDLPTTYLSGPGDYRLTATDACHSVTREFTLNSPNAPLLQSLAEGASILSSTSAIIIGQSGGSGSPYTTQISPVPFVPSITFDVDGPGSLAGSYTIDFPINIPDDIQASNTYTGLPLGTYEVTTTDCAGNTITNTITLTEPASYEHEISIDFSCENSNTLSFITHSTNGHGNRFGRARLFMIDGGGGGVLIEDIPGSMSGSFYNLPAGDYLLELRGNPMGMNGHMSDVAVGVRSSSGIPYTLPVTIPPYEDMVIAVFSTLCDATDPNSGVVSVSIIDGSPVYPTTYELFTNPGGVLIDSYTAMDASDASALNHIFSGVEPGEYTVRTSNFCYIREDNLTLSDASEQITVQVSANFLCPGDPAAILAIGLNPNQFDINWYEGTIDPANIIATGVSLIEVSPDDTTTYILEYVLNAVGACANPTVFSEEIEIIVTADPDETVAVSYDLCENNTITIGNSQIGFTYEVLNENGDSFDPQITGEGNGGDLVIIDIPYAVVGTEYTITLTNGAEGCSGVLNNTILFTTCCIYEVTCPSFEPIAVECYEDLPNETTLTVEEFEALGIGNGTIGNNPCGIIEITAENSPDTGVCGQTVTRTYTITEYEDTNGNGIRDEGEDTVLNSSVCTQTITVQDTTPPVIVSPPMDMTVECDGGGNTAELAAWLANNGGGVATDNCGDVTWGYSLEDTDNTCGNTSATTYNFMATDGCGNSVSTQAAFIIVDTVPPVIDVQAQDLTVECDGNGNANDLNAWLNNRGGAMASDVCGGPITWGNDFNGLGDDCGNTGSATVTFTATDACGNSSTTTATFTIVDTTAPVLVNQAQDQTVECGSGNATALTAWLNNNGGAVAQDMCSSITWSNDFDELSAACGNTGSATVTFTATDACGNSVSTIATFTIVDTTAPLVEVPAQDLTVECDGMGNTIALNDWLANNGGAAATDSCGDVTWSNNFTTLSDGCGNTGSATVAFTAIDDCGNSVSTIATFTIVDTIAPVIDISPSDETVECDGGGNTAELAAWLASNGGGVASDACGDVTWSYSLEDTDNTCGNTSATTYNFMATDGCGNSVSAQAVFIIVDTSPPVIDVQAQDLTVECDGNGNANDLNAWLNNRGGAMASDVCGGPITWGNDFSGLDDDCGNTGSATVTFTATDACGNSSTTTATFTIVDTTAPVLITPASNLRVECNDTQNPKQLMAWLNNNGGATAMDDCSGVIWSNDYDEANWLAACGNTGEITVIFTATDACGNQTPTSATFIIEDTTAPVFVQTLPGDLRLECDETIPAPIELTAYDNCGEAVVTFTENIVNEVCDNTYVIERVWVATDACGNTTTHTQRIFVEDTLAPIFISNLPQDMYIKCDTIPEAPELEAIDFCGEVTVSLEEYEELGDCSSKSRLVRVWTATDSCGNSTVHRQVIHLSCQIEVYNAVSTVDNRNYFKLEGIDCFPNNTLKIFNRWGVLVYETERYDNVNEVFTGFSKGRATINNDKQLPTGAYFFILEYEFSSDNISSEIIKESGYLYLNSSN